MRYSKTNKSKKNGVVYTPTEMANYIASEMIKYYSADFSNISILDPAAGEGELLIALVNQLSPKCHALHVVGYETDADVATGTEEKLKNLYPNIDINIRHGDFLEAIEKHQVEKFDLIIANPPYIRTQIMGSARAQEIAQKLSLTGKIDIYFAFLLYVKDIMKSTSVSGFITSNKFMTIKSGNAVRNYMLDNYMLHQITDLGDTKLFDASVLPCIIVFSIGQTTDCSSVSFTSVYQENNATSLKTFTENIFDTINCEGLYEVPDGRCFKFRQGTLHSAEHNTLWTMSSDEDNRWLENVSAKTWMTFSDLGKIRVGIKTTADNVFIGDNWAGENAELELLKPLITHRNAGQIIANTVSHWKVLYTHEMKNGKKIACDLDQYPKSKAYLLQHYDQLNSRSYIKKAKRNWYEIWVPQNPSAWQHRKIVFRDISEKPQFWLDESGAIVNGDCYWIDIAPNITEDIVYLALAVANSKFIEKYYDIKFNTKLYSGKRRYQTQYVEEFPIPSIESDLAQEAICLVKKIIAEGENTDTSSYKEQLDIIVGQLFY